MPAKMTNNASVSLILVFAWSAFSARGARARHGVLRWLQNDSQIRPIRLAAQAQRPAAVRGKDPSRRDLLSKGRVRKGALPVPWGIVHGPKSEAGRARIAEAQRRRWRAYRQDASRRPPATINQPG